MSKQHLKNIAKAILVFAVIFNFAYIFKTSYSVDYLKKSFAETQNLTNELKLLKGDLIPDETTTVSETSLTQTLISKLDQYYLNEQSENSLQDVKNFIQTNSEISLPEGYSTQTINANSFTVNNSSQHTLATVSYDNLSQTLSLKSFTTNKQYNLYQFPEFQDTFSSLIKKENLDQESKLYTNYQQFLQLSENLQSNSQANIITEKSLEIIPPFHSNQKAYLNFLKQGEKMVYITTDLEDINYKLVDQSGETIFTSAQQSELITKFFNYTKDKNFSTLIEKNIQAKINFITQTLNETELLESLKEKGYSISEPLDSNTEYTIGIINQNQTPILSIKIDKVTSQVFLTSQGDTSQLDFKDLNFELPEVQKNIENHLILGRHGSLTDTIIIANFNNQTEEVKLISLPRDLYIENKKINSIYTYKGLKALITEIESITGLNIDKYALIDMYTFIDVVDTLGGIDVILDKPLVDPSYTTYDNNEWGTLSLPAGKHNVNGRQALRIARSRYSTSDFDRAHRQHLILNGLKNRVTELGAKDAKTITELALLGMESTETNLSFKDILSYYGKYKDYELTDKIVLSTGNILTSTYTGSLNSSDPNATTTAQNRGAYILLPKNNDWSLIRTFVYSFLSS
jgi:LCP family protein required for cell wall assembly